MLLTASFAAAAGTGSWNASSVAATKCGPGVQAVYTCSNYAVKVVSSGGSTFYKSDGSVLNCPNAPLAQAGAECMQLLVPDPCLSQVNCGTPVSQNQTAPTTPANLTANASVGSETVPAPVVAPVNSTGPAKAAGTPTGQAANQSEINVPTAAPNNFDFSMDNLALVVLLLGAVAVAVLFTLFKNSISE
jgi:hypothetical protein